jgi:DNA-binding LacI/PurR family transcriptional regulator
MKKKKPSSTSPPRVTHQDIANALGVSRSTVSLALKNHPRITEAVRRKIQAKAAELAYTPDPMLSALAHYRQTNRAKTAPVPLAWVNLHQNPEVIHQHREFALYLQGASTFAAEQGFKIEEFAIADVRPARLNTILKTRNIRGILLSPPDLFYGADWSLFPWSDYATVRFGRSTDVPPVDFVTSAQSSNAMLAFDTIRARGYQRVGLVTDYRRRRVFGAGFFWAQFELPEEQQLPLLNIPREMPPQQQRDVLKNWMVQYRPDAILSDIPHLTQLLEQLDYRIPRDVALATTNINESPIDAGIDQKPEVIGKAAVRTLLSLLHSQSFGLPADSNEILVKGEWKDGSMLPRRS